jgi:hypothetical protein
MMTHHFVSLAGMVMYNANSINVGVVPEVRGWRCCQKISLNTPGVANVRKGTYSHQHFSIALSEKRIDEDW